QMEPMELPGPKARAYLKRDSSVVSPSYPRAYPLVVDHAKGSEIWDVDGNRFLDFMAGIAVTSTGHSHPKVVKAIQEQAAQFIHVSSDVYHPKMIELAEKLNEVAPFHEAAVAFLGNSGTEAVEAAIKLARYHTGRSNFIGFTGAFHGRTMGAVTFTASKPKYHAGFYPLMNGVVHAPFPNPYRPVLDRKSGEDYGETVVRYIREEILEHILPPDEVAGILVETIQGEGGYLVPPDGFFPALRKLCDEHEILLMADEVQCGMGRTGKWWAIEHFGIEPDILTSAKGIASGVPMGACIARQSVMDWEAGAHGNTFGGNPIACAAALATMELIEKQYMANAAEVGQYTLDALEEIKARHPSIGDVRGKGLMIGVEFVLDRKSKEPAHDLCERIMALSFERGLLTLSCGKSVMRIAPALSIKTSEIDEGLNIFEEAISLAEKEASL
ncbi:MAG TPA: acetyl ornithine aminotransferase family protein, partial [Anaerolineales bacterium]|nr:acetyl ornithine aminotransferase family protein [Anaerolineales bacterium]